MVLTMENRKENRKYGFSEIQKSENAVYESIVNGDFCFWGSEISLLTNTYESVNSKLSNVAL
jgi:hypothetical protein